MSKNCIVINRIFDVIQAKNAVKNKSFSFNCGILEEVLWDVSLSLSKGSPFGADGSEGWSLEA
jgi:hypothetical protein